MQDNKIFKKLKFIVDDLAETLAEMEKVENPTTSQREYVISTAQYMGKLLNLLGDSMGEEKEVKPISIPVVEEKKEEPVVPQVKVVSSPGEHLVEKAEVPTPDQVPVEPVVEVKTVPVQELMSEHTPVAEAPKPVPTPEPTPEVRAPEPAPIHQEKIPESIEEILMAARKASAQAKPAPQMTKEEPTHIETQTEITEKPHAEKRVEYVDQKLASAVKVSQSLNDRMAQKEDNSLLSRLQKKPGGDLKTTIGLNEKLMFIKTLFNGEHEAYSATISHINGITQKSEAMSFIASSLVPKYEWNKKESEAKQFKALVEKKFGN
jgi:hypothetical protein